METLNPTHSLIQKVIFLTAVSMEKPIVIALALPDRRVRVGVKAGEECMNEVKVVFSFV